MDYEIKLIDELDYDIDEMDDNQITKDFQNVEIEFDFKKYTIDLSMTFYFKNEADKSGEDNSNEFVCYKNSPNVLDVWNEDGALMSFEVSKLVAIENYIKSLQL